MGGCHKGTPGILEHFISMYKITGEDEFLGYAKRTARFIISQSVVSDEPGDIYKQQKKRNWYGNWWRTIPQNVHSYTGLYIGTTGNAWSLLSLAGVLEGKEWIQTVPERNTLDGVLTFDNVPKERIIRYFNEFDFQYDEVVEVNADLAYEVGRDLVRTDGIFLGQSAAATIKVATGIAKDRKQRERRSLRSVQTMHSNIYRRIFTDSRRKLIRS